MYGLTSNIFVVIFFHTFLCVLNNNYKVRMDLKQSQNKKPEPETPPLKLISSNLIIKKSEQSLPWILQ